MRKYIFVLFLFLLVGCGYLPTTTSPISPNAASSAPSYSFDGVWLSTVNQNHETVVIDVQSEAGNDLAVENMIAYSCLDFAPYGGVNYPLVQKANTSISFTALQGNSFEVGLQLFTFDSSGNVHEYPALFDFVGQFATSTELTMKSSSNGYFTDLTFEKSSVPSSQLVQSAETQYNNTSC